MTIKLKYSFTTATIMLNAVPHQAYEIVKHFEGLYLTSYLCPASVYTIGYGTTGAWVKPGMVITLQQAEAYLQESLISVANSVPDNIWSKLQERQRAALVSFLYNVGTGAIDAPSFGRAIRNNIADVPLRLLDWDKAVVNGVKQPLLGLTRRRRSEAILWSNGRVITDYQILDNLSAVQSYFTQPSNVAPISLLNALKYYREEPHQRHAWEWLDAQINADQRQYFGTLYRGLPASKPIEVLPHAVNPWLIFDMPLGDRPTSNIVVGTLRLKGFPNTNSATEWQCTSGQPGYQYSGATDIKGKGALPGHRYVKDQSGKPIKHYWVSTSPTNLKGVKGIDGNAYHITPDPLLINSTWRSELMLHRDANKLYSPGSAGCIVTIVDSSFTQIEQLMRELKTAGYNRIPLEVNH